MKKLILLLHFTFIVFHFTFSQTAPGIEWQNTIGGSDTDGLSSMQQTSDGGYILGGSSRSYISGDKNENSIGDYDYWIVKTDSAGSIQWQNTIGGNDYDGLVSAKQTNDGGYILGGSSRSYISADKTENCIGNSDYWIVKTDSVGNIQWQNTIGGHNYDALSSILQTTDGGFMLAGSSSSDISGDKIEDNLDTLCNPYCTYDYWIVKTDSIGNIQWQNTIGGSLNDQLTEVIQTNDGGFLFVGFSFSNISGDKSEDNLDTVCIPYCTSDFWIVKTDSIGNIQWQNTIGGNSYDNLYAVKQTSDGGFILGGQSKSNVSFDKMENCWGDSDYWIVKTDSIGNIHWQNTIGGSAGDQLRSIEITTDSGYILCGFSQSNISGDKNENTNGWDDYWVVKTDSTGYIQWQKTIGGSGSDYLFPIVKTNDKGYILGGYSDSNISGDKTENCIGNADYWIVKLYPDTTTGIANIQTSINNIQLFPNPAKEETTISGYTLQNNQPAQLNIFDVMGKQVLSQYITNLNSQIINLKSFASGVYFVQLQSGLKVSRAKFVKQ